MKTESAEDIKNKEYLRTESSGDDIKKIEHLKKKIYNFLSREWQIFNLARKLQLKDLPKVSSKLDFEKMLTEFQKDEDGNYPAEHWRNQAVCRPGERIPRLVTTLLTGLVFTFIPNCLIVLDYTAAYEYINGTYYQVYGDENIATLNKTDCRIVYECFGRTYYQVYDDQNIATLNETDCRILPNTVECFEKNPYFGWMTLGLNFLPGVCWSLPVLYRISTALRKRNPDFWQRKRMLFLFFLPFSLLRAVTFPLQLLVISFISCFHDQDQWALLTVKIGIAEGIFNAHFQFLLQIFIFFTSADRHPSTSQYLAAGGSLFTLAYSRVDSLLLNRDGRNMTAGQLVWVIIRYVPIFFFNCAFKLGSICLIVSLLRCNAIWLYGFVILVSFLLKVGFNERLLPRRFYHLFVGSGLHAIREGFQKF